MTRKTTFHLAWNQLKSRRIMTTMINTVDMSETRWNSQKINLSVDFLSRAWCYAMFTVCGGPQQGDRPWTLKRQVLSLFTVNTLCRERIFRNTSTTLQWQAQAVGEWKQRKKLKYHRVRARDNMSISNIPPSMEFLWERWWISTYNFSGIYNITILKVSEIPCSSSPSWLTWATLAQYTQQQG